MGLRHATFKTFAQMTIAILLLIWQLPALADTGDLTEFTTSGYVCAGNSTGLYADLDGNSVYETLVVVATFTGSEAFSQTQAYTYYGTKNYFFTGVNSHCGGTFPYQRGSFAIWFVDMLAPGFVVNSPATWTYKSVSGAQLAVSSNLDMSADPLNVRIFRAYSERIQGGTLVGQYAVNGSQNTATTQICEFASAQGIKEIHFYSDFAENMLWSLIVRSGATCVPPTLGEHSPSVTTVCAGAPLDLFQYGGGTMPLTYVWTLNGDPIAGATSDTYHVDHADAANAGVYEVRISNDCGIVTSSPLVVLVATGPVFNLQPSDVTACPGSPATFTVAVGTPSGTTYQWYHDNVAVPGATGVSLTLGSVAAADAGSYHCTATSSCGSVNSASAELTVTCGSNVYRVNAGGPQVATTDAGPNWTSDSSVGGYSPYVNHGAIGNTLSSTGVPISLSHPSIPAGTPMEIFQTDRWDDAGAPEMTWSFPVANSVYAVDLYLSENFFYVGGPGQRVFDVTCEGLLRLDNVDIYAEAGGAFKGLVKTFEVQVSDGNLDLTFVHQVQNPDVCAIGIRLACSQPTIQSQPLGAVICPNGTATFQVQATGTPPLTYQWRHNGVAIADSTRSSLVIAPVNSGNTGVYDVIVQNPCGSVTSSEAYLEQNCPSGWFRVDAGGSGSISSDAGPAWTADTPGTPSPWVNHAAIGNNITHWGVPIDMSDPTVPPTTPMSIMQNERWDDPSPPEMMWSFPTGNGTFRVDLYVAESYVTGWGQREFDVNAEGGELWKAIDPFGQVNGNNMASVLTEYVTVQDGTLNLEFLHRTQNPLVRAFDIRRSRDFRVNVGGPTVAATDGGPTWLADTGASPSAYVNAIATGNTLSSTSAVIDLGDSSVPAGTPMALFQDDRWDGELGPEMAWNFPTGPGSYLVRLYFAETHGVGWEPGDRLFDVDIEGTEMLDEFDVYGTVGLNRAVVRTFYTIVEDDMLTVAFRHVVENPALKAIEVLRRSGGASNEEVPPAAVGSLMDQNAPNPFNPLTTIAFDLPHAGLTTLRVYDLAGRLVRTLADEEMTAGRHKFVWDGRDDTNRACATGVYLYQLNSGKTVETRRMLLLK